MTIGLTYITQCPLYPLYQERIVFENIIVIEFRTTVHIRIESSLTFIFLEAKEKHRKSRILDLKHRRNQLLKSKAKSTTIPPKPKENTVRSVPKKHNELVHLLSSEGERGEGE